jgi:hypothetical protein
MDTLPADLLRNPVFRLFPLKGARNAGEGRPVSLAPATARTLAVYLRRARLSLLRKRVLLTAQSQPAIRALSITK